jgi:hypothetical protein
METIKYVRKPFEVEAVQVSAENIEEVAEWCAGSMETEGDDKYIKVRVARVLNDRQTKAFIGDWVLYAGTGYKVYTAKAFAKTFDRVQLQGQAKDEAVQATKGQLEELQAAVNGTS